MAYCMIQNMEEMVIEHENQITQLCSHHEQVKNEIGRELDLTMFWLSTASILQTSEYNYFYRCRFYIQSNGNGRKW